MQKSVRYATICHHHKNSWKVKLIQFCICQFASSTPLKSWMSTHQFPGGKVFIHK